MNKRQRNFPRSNRQAKRLRVAATSPERSAWDALRTWETGPGRFRRQCPIGPYIVDFVCHAAKLIIEIDGPVHDFPGRKERDSRREAWLVSQGFRVLRVTPGEAHNEDRLVARIRAAL